MTTSSASAHRRPATVRRVLAGVCAAPGCDREARWEVSGPAGAHLCCGRPLHLVGAVDRGTRRPVGTVTRQP